jgi:hypothetical protein
MKKLSLFGISIAILFIFLGIQLIQREDTFTVVVGYANIIFFAGLIIFALYKQLSNRNRI